MSCECCQPSGQVARIGSDGCFRMKLRRLFYIMRAEKMSGMHYAYGKENDTASLKQYGFRETIETTLNSTRK